jgi:ATP-dependent Lhr-like helicase
MFHPLVESWFAETYREPTAVQKEAWPLIEKGENVLALAPTGSGKTLTAFLAALSRFIDGTWEPEKLRCLYVSPLKALNEDIRRNLLEPLAGLQKKAETDPAFAAYGPFPAIRVETRSGDTPQAERRRFLIHPPSILAVTPESLGILLINPRGREVLSTLRYLVLDEIHAVMGTKRGAFLSCQIDRLSLAAGEFQRVALSATVRPMTEAAEFAGGLYDRGNGIYEKRKFAIVSPQTEKQIDFSVEFPNDDEDPEKAAGDGNADHYGRRYAILVKYILERIQALNSPGRNKNEKPARTLLVFTDSRRRAERISFLLNEAAGKRISLCHHGSLSKEIRGEVEQSLAEGRVPCVVATSSLELGIDIGAVDEVILAGAVSGCAQALQRIGRAGHGVGRISRARFLPFHAADLISGAALAGAVADREIEETHPVKNPLDVLAQIVLALAAEKPRTSAELYALVKGFRAYADLSRSNFDQVIAMLAGRYFQEESGQAGILSGEKNPPPDRMTFPAAELASYRLRIRELKPRLFIDIDGSCRAAPGVTAFLYSSGGVIPNRGLYSMRLPDGTKIGELDEEFVFERRPGDSFDFGGRSWNIGGIGDEAVTVSPAEGGAGFQPFWRADTPFRSSVLCRRVLGLFDDYENSVRKKNLPPAFSRYVSEEAAEALTALLEKQREAQGSVRLPGQAHIPVEIVDDAARPDSYRVVFHSFRGGALNYPLGFALAGLLEEKTGSRIETIIDDNALLLLLPRIAVRNPETLIGEVLPELAVSGESRFLRRLESSGIFGAAFREAAELSLMIPRGIFGRRVPLWVTRRRAKRLYDKVRGQSGFPVISEAWRICLADRFDMNGFRDLLEGLAGGSIKTSVFRSRSPTPFARDLTWKETSAFMYEYDERSDMLDRPGTTGVARYGGTGSGAPGFALSDKAIADAVGDPRFRPRLDAGLVNAFTAKLRRELPGWSPEDPLSLAEWVRERVAIPAGEWETLAAVLPAELREELLRDPGLGGRVAEIGLPGAAVPVIVHRDLYIPPENPAAIVFLPRLGEWLRYEGPVSARRVAAVFGCTAAEAEDAADGLVEAGEAAGGIRVEDEENLYCDAENFDLLLRLARKKARPRIRERPADLLAPFLALRQGLIPGADSSGDSPFAVFSCYAVPARLWETEILPARIQGYKPETLDAALAGGELVWFGAGKDRIGFCAPEELELTGIPALDHISDELRIIISFCRRYRNFWEIKDELIRSGFAGDTRTVVNLMWEAVWSSLISSDSFQAVRRGPDQGLSLQETAWPGGRVTGDIPGITPRYGPRRKARFVPGALREKWREGAPIPGNWFSLLPEAESDRLIKQGDGVLDESRINQEFITTDEFSALEEAELNQDRVRLLLRRWGIAAKPFFERESSAFSWSALLPAMRRMELAGELVTGRFIEGIHSLQFAAPSVAGELEAAEAVSAVYWMNAADPASPSGLDGLDKRLPPRTANARLCFRGAALIAVSTKSGGNLNVYIGPDDTDCPKIVEFIKAPRTRVCGPVKKLTIETINGQSAASSPWADPLIAAGFIADRGRLFLW